MRIGDFIYFAPDVRFTDLDLDGPRLPGQFQARIQGFLLGPAERCAEHGDAFAAGLLCVVAIDAMSRLNFGPNRLRRIVRQDFCVFAQDLLPSFRDRDKAKLLYEGFRNGLVHEARLKDGCQFSLKSEHALDLTGPTPTVNPRLLLAEVRSALGQMVSEMEASAQYRREFTKLLRTEFAFELADGNS